MADQGRSDLYLGFTKSLCKLELKHWIKTLVNKFAISNHMALIMGVHALKEFVNMSFIAYQIKMLVAQGTMVKITPSSDCPWSTIFCVIIYLSNNSENLASIHQL